MDYELSLLRAIDYTMICLQDNLANILKEYQNQEEGLSLPVPRPESYFIAYAPSDADSVIMNDNVAVMIGQASSSLDGSKYSGDVDRIGQDKSVFIEVTIFFNDSKFVEYRPAHFKYPINRQSHMARRAYYYGAAVVKCIYESLVCSSNGWVSQVLDTTDDANVITGWDPENQKWLSAATVVFEYDQKTMKPVCKG